jgi:hypothetical protein
MKRLFSLILFIFLFVFVIEAQKQDVSPTPSSQDEIEEPDCGLIKNLVVIKVWVNSDKKGFSRDLIVKNFKVYDEKAEAEIAFFMFDEQTNQYIIGFYQEDFTPDNKWHEVEVKVKLSAEEKKKFGKVSVSGQTGYYPNQN